jgi:ABC-type Zn uptake system ZnuABC Zn-binding protein ZnuA/ABC-type Mn2+/Zn2+ transport system permease subunit
LFLRYSLPAVLESLDLPFVQRGLAEVALLSVGAGLIGTWVVLRGLAFHSHAVGTAAFPGLVLADGLGFAAALGALGAALVFAVLVAVIGRRRADDRGADVALVLVGMLAAGVILASDVFESSAAIETLLFGSLLLIDGGDLALAAGVSALAVAAAAVAGRHWVAHGFDPSAPDRARAALLEPALLVLVALGTAAAVTAVGALLVTALFVVPAATTRIWTSRMRTWQAATVALAAAEGIVGVVLSVELNAPPGATIAVLAGVVFAVAAVAAAVRGRSSAGGGIARWAAAGAALFLIAGCGSDEGDEPRVVATTPIVGDLATEVAGDDAEVTTLLSANTDPHDYEPRPDDVEALAQADLVIASGGDLDEWVGDAVADSGSDAGVLDLSAAIVPEPIEDDPHWWHDPRRTASATAAITDELLEVAPDAAAAIRSRARGYVSEIRATDRAIERCIGAVPADDRKLVTDHDAFGYLAGRYGIEIVGAVIPALTTQAQPSAGELADLRETIDREGVSAVFPEASVNTDLADAIARETGATADYELYGDSLGPAGSDGDTYLGMLAANAEALVRGFTGGERGCEAGG